MPMSEWLPAARCSMTLRQTSSWRACCLAELAWLQSTIMAAGKISQDTIPNLHGACNFPGHQQHLGPHITLQRRFSVRPEAEPLRRSSESAIKHSAEQGIPRLKRDGQLQNPKRTSGAFGRHDQPRLAFPVIETNAAMDEKLKE